VPDHIFRVFELATLLLLGEVVAGFVEPFDLVVVVVGDEVALLFDPTSVNPPASVSTHIAENFGCAPHEILVRL
jgi:hypothetical protein